LAFQKGLFLGDDFPDTPYIVDCSAGTLGELARETPNFAAANRPVARLADG
jgi:hypothetical protein